MITARATALHKRRKGNERERGQPNKPTGIVNEIDISAIADEILLDENLMKDLNISFPERTSGNLVSIEANEASKVNENTNENTIFQSTEPYNPMCSKPRISYHYLMSESDCSNGEESSDSLEHFEVITSSPKPLKMNEHSHSTRKKEQQKKQQLFYPTSIPEVSDSLSQIRRLTMISNTFTKKEVSEKASNENLWFNIKLRTKKEPSIN